MRTGFTHRLIGRSTWIPWSVWFSSSGQLFVWRRISGKTADTGGESFSSVIYGELLSVVLWCGLSFGPQSTLTHHVLILSSNNDVWFAEWKTQIWSPRRTNLLFPRSYSAAGLAFLFWGEDADPFLNLKLKMLSRWHNVSQPLFRQSKVLYKLQLKSFSRCPKMNINIILSKLLKVFWNCWQKATYSRRNYLILKHGQFQADHWCF